MVFPILGSGDSSSGYDIDNSLRFGTDSYAHSAWGAGSGGTTTCTISQWIKRSNIGSWQSIWGGADADSSQYYRTQGVFNSTDTFYIELHDGSGTSNYWETNMKFKDVSAWYHIVTVFDTTNGTAGDRIKLYVNGNQITSWLTQQTTPQNQEVHLLDNGDRLQLATRYNNGAVQNFYDGYMAQVHVIDGTVKAASDFGEFDDNSGIWKPKEYDGAYGTNGFFLEFKETGTSANSSGMGADTSGEDNHLTVTNLVAATDHTADTPTNNFATFNSLHPSVGNPSNQTPLVYSEGNTKVVGQTSGVAYSFAISTIAVSSGKWYYEFYRPDTDSGTVIAGAQNPGNMNTHGSHDMSISNNGGVGVRASNGELYNDGSYSSVTNATQWPDAGDILSVKLNMDDDEISFSTNGASYTAAQSLSSNVLSSGFVAPGSNIGDDEELTVNLGNPNWALSSGNADANGYGNFEYAVPANYYAICSKNLAKYGG